MKPRKALPRFDASEPVIRAAGAWLARRDRGFATAEKAEFETWLRTDATHAAAVAQLERAMLSFDRLRELVPVGETRPDPDAFAPRSRVRHWIHWSSAAATTAAALVIIFWTLRPGAPPALQFATGPGG